ncbi:MAG: glycosyltransferase [Firmicutes bacterium]|uniref:Glycosyltransferase n=1 Tax=Candidatus Onthovivens merdipullorum TaxID=2840889 RepID=A0A9D9DHX9_9BACL|nr:glycosyltransferase [Candidatus Onthovivens merdipullorum]
MIDYEFVVNCFDIAIVCALIIFLLLSLPLILYFIEAFNKSPRFPRGKKLYKYAILIPARNEDKVITHILESLKKQTYPKEYFDVYVIIESKDDPTFNITKKFGYNVYIRKDLINKRTKGFALKEVIEYINGLNKNYDAYMIFDADNIVSEDYIYLLNDVKNKGYQIGVGYRNFTNSTENWISACSATLFSFMNQFTSKGRSKFFNKATLTGTGYYIDKKVVDDAGGWIWTGLTEDVALTTYSYYHNVKMHYYPYAMYYDEQPTTFKYMHRQHIRWVFGFVENKSKYKKGVMYGKKTRRLGIIEYSLAVWPFATFVIVEFLAFITLFFLFIFACIFDTWDAALWVGGHALFNLLCLYGSFIFASLIAIGLDNKNLKFKPKTIFKICFTYIFFFIDFALAFIDGFIHKKKRKNWVKIEHSGNVTNKDLKKK